MKKNLILFILGIVVVGAILIFSVRDNQDNQAKAQAISEFAACLADEGAKFYGAFWCSHCKNQKDIFGTAAGELPYIECSTADAQSQTDVCITNRISAYPTWEFSDGSRLTGELSFEELAGKTRCQAPA